MKKILGLLLALCCALSAAALGGCGRKVPDTDQTLEVYVLDAGYGNEWCKDLLALFKEQDWVKEKYPQLKTVFTHNNVRSYGSTRLGGGANANTIDLLFDTDLNKQTYDGPDGVLEDLAESVYNSKVPGEEITWSKKATDSYNKSNRYTDVTGKLDGEHYYMTSWVDGMVSFLYNETLLDSLGLTVPRTTDELEEVCEAIKTAKSTPTAPYYCFIQAKENTYWDYLHDVWWAQYEGIDNYRSFWEGYADADAKVRSNKIFSQQGKLETLKVYETLLDSNKGYYDRSSSTYNFITAQTRFLEGNAAFTVCGDWFDNEMRATAKKIEKDNGRIDTIKMMPTPIVSALGTKLGITETTLREVVDYVDKTAAGESAQAPQFTSTEGVSADAVIDAVKEARTVVFSLGNSHNAVIPKYAKGKQVAIDFLRFMATDIACEQFVKSTGGATLPFNYNVKEKNGELYDSLSALQKSRLDYFNNHNAYTLPSLMSFPLAKYGKLAANAENEYLGNFAANPKVKSAAQMFEDTKTYWTQKRFETACDNAGLLY